MARKLFPNREEVFKTWLVKLVYSLMNNGKKVNYEIYYRITI